MCPILTQAVLTMSLVVLGELLVWFLVFGVSFLYLGRIFYKVGPFSWQGFLHPFDPNIRKEIRRLEYLNMNIKRKNTPWSIKPAGTMTCHQNTQLYIYIYIATGITGGKV